MVFFSYFTVGSDIKISTGDNRCSFLFRFLLSLFVCSFCFLKFFLSFSQFLFQLIQFFFTCCIFLSRFFCFLMSFCIVFFCLFTGFFCFCKFFPCRFKIFCKLLNVSAFQKFFCRQEFFQKFFCFRFCQLTFFQFVLNILDSVQHFFHRTFCIIQILKLIAQFRFLSVQFVSGIFQFFKPFLFFRCRIFLCFQIIDFHFDILKRLIRV